MNKENKFQRQKGLIAALILFFAGVSTALHAQGDLLITPFRVVFEGTKNLEEISLANTGKDTARYTLTFVQYRMTEIGSFEKITEPDPGQLFADKYLRIFPKTVTLAPNESQVVKLQLKKPADLAGGEYRSHIYFRAVPKSEAPENNGNDSTLGINLIPVYGITIPVILRHGELSVTATATDFSFAMVNDTLPTINFTINREGSKSVFGDIKIDYIAPDGKETKVGAAKGVSVYTPNAMRKFSIRLLRLPDINYRQGRLKISYSFNAGPKPEVYFETFFNLQ